MIQQVRADDRKDKDRSSKRQGKMIKEVRTDDRTGKDR